MANDGKRELKGTAYEIFIVLLSLLSVLNVIVAVLAGILRPDGGPAQEVLVSMELIITPVFVFDFLYRLVTAPSRRGYFIAAQGWADLLACIPLLRVFRLVRVARVIRLLRAYGLQRIVADLSANRASATFLVTIFLVVLVVEIAGAAIYYVEAGAPDSNIHSASDAIWWGLVTITTVGYGDRYPVTLWGRVIGVFLLFAGIGLFSVLTGFIANLFLSPRATPRIKPAADDPRAAILKVRGLLLEQEERTAAIRQHLDDLERSLGTRAVDRGASGPEPATAPGS
jgi:voltage-gated potassium channel